MPEINGKVVTITITITITITDARSGLGKATAQSL
jgi:hypothetical protein